GRPMGDCGRDVGGARPQHALRRVPGKANSGRQALLPAEVWSGRENRLESRFLRLQLATPANLQALRPRLLYYAKDVLERHYPIPLQTLLVGISGWQPHPYL